MKTVRSTRLPAEFELELGLEDSEEPAALRARAARLLGRAVETVPEPLVLRRSIDARRGSVKIRLLVGFEREPVDAADAHLPRTVGERPRIIIVGAGPAGLFAAYALARRGIRSIVLERGKPVQPRRHDLKPLNRSGRVDPDSNYCFGEGGAGTFSDGKLYTRAHKRGSVRDVLEILALHGAPEAILTEARPHIGSNRLPKVVTALRERLERVGVEFRFGARVSSLAVDLDDAGARRVRGVALTDGSELTGDAVVLACGHSARDVFALAQEAGLRLEPKAFALGVRIEHPQPLINHIQYGTFAGHARLPNAAYRVAETVEGRGVFSFCMCPGGWIVPAATEPDGVVVNGMSLARRDSPFANSGLVVAVEPADWERAGFKGPLGGVELQRRLEHLAFRAGGGELRAPATRVTDFIARRASSTVPESSYIPGIVASDLRSVLDGAGLAFSGRLARALEAFGKKLRGYVTEEAVLVAVESRTSAPVRIVRDERSLEAVGLCGLYPTGEGAGYAGGIVSAALDGMRVAEAVMRVSAPNTS